MAMAETNLCDQCAALCCRYVALPIDNPEDVRDYDNVRWYLMHENIHVFVEKKQWYIGFATKCKHLQPDNRCGVYETRPRICRDYTTDNCDWHGGTYEYDHLFTSAEQLRVFAENELGRPLPKVEKPTRLKKPRKKKVGGKNAVELPVQN
jgi:Fe-S-cluster containining protein